MPDIIKLHGEVSTNSEVDRRFSSYLTMATDYELHKAY